MPPSVNIGSVSLKEVMFYEDHLAIVAELEKKIEILESKASQFESTLKETMRVREDFEPELAAKALAAALKYLKSEWGLSNENIAKILKVSKTTVKNWLDEESVPVGRGTLSADVEALISLLSIQKSLFAMFSTPPKQLEWLNTVHPVFGDKPLNLMMRSNEDLFATRQYLDYVGERGA